MELNGPTFIEHLEEDNDEAPRRSKRQRTEKSFGDDFIIYLVDDTPKTIAEAYSSPDADYWKEAVRSEMDSIMSNGSWEVVERPYGCKPVGCKWVLKKKLRPNGTFFCGKESLYIKGDPSTGYGGYNTERMANSASSCATLFCSLLTLQKLTETRKELSFRMSQMMGATNDLSRPFAWSLSTSWEQSDSKITS
jgi:hypothetical protein